MREYHNYGIVHPLNVSFFGNIVKSRNPLSNVVVNRVVHEEDPSGAINPVIGDRVDVMITQEEQFLGSADDAPLVYQVAIDAIGSPIRLFDIVIDSSGKITTPVHEHIDVLNLTFDVEVDWTPEAVP